MKSILLFIATICRPTVRLGSNTIGSESNLVPCTFHTPKRLNIFGSQISHKLQHLVQKYLTFCTQTCKQLKNEWDMSRCVRLHMAQARLSVTSFLLPLSPIKPTYFSIQVSNNYRMVWFALLCSSFNSLVLCAVCLALGHRLVQSDLTDSLRHCVRPLGVPGHRPPLGLHVPLACFTEERFSRGKNIETTKGSIFHTNSVCLCVRLH